MLKFKHRQRALLTDKLPDVANLAVGGLIFGQLLSDRPFSIPVAVLGAVLWLLFMAYSIFLARRE